MLSSLGHAVGLSKGDAMRGVLAGMVLLLAACGTPGPDAATVAACDELMYLTDDRADGIAGEAEVAVRARKIHEEARGSAVEEEARALAVAVANGEGPVPQMNALGAACEEAGALERR
jgi:hypothetical protein